MTKKITTTAHHAAYLAVRDALRTVEGRASARTLSLNTVLGCVRLMGAAGEKPRLARSYKYPASYTIAAAAASPDGTILTISRETTWGGGGATRSVLCPPDLGGPLALPNGEYSVGSAKARKIFDADGQMVGRAYLLSHHLPAALRSGPRYWEHAPSLKAARAERARKIQVRLDREAEDRATARDLRRARLLGRLSAVPVVLADALAVGHCEIGIRSWAAARGYDVTATLPISVVAHDPDERAVRVAVFVALRAVRAARAAGHRTAAHG